MNEDVREVSDETIEESFEEILYGDACNEGEIMEIETEPLCASCYNPLDVDEEQTIAYCERCEVTVFIERRVIDSSL